jgi:general secretion pathway protein D
VIFLNHADAEKLVPVLQQLVGQQVSPASQSAPLALPMRTATSWTLQAPADLSAPSTFEHVLASKRPPIPPSLTYIAKKKPTGSVSMTKIC